MINNDIINNDIIEIDNTIEIDNVYSLKINKSVKISNLIIIDIYEFDTIIYSLKISPQVFSSILTSCSYLTGSKNFKTVLGDDIILTKESEYILLSINNKINLRLSKVNIDKLFDIFVKLISN